MNNKKITTLNVFSSLLYQIIYLAYGLIVPRLVLGSFGSEVNGLVSSVSQFLGLITILEGGVGGVIRASLYKPLAEHNEKKLSAVYNAANIFYRKLAFIYAIYGLFVACFYPIIFKINFSWPFTFVLILIIVTQTFIQYFFAVNLRSLIFADRKGYIISFVSILMQILTLVLTIIVINLFPNILLLKAVGIVVYAIQPIIYSIYVKKHYKINLREPADKDSLSQRWSGFGQNLAFFIHSNTDVVVLTIFSTLLDVSVYSVYFMIVFALRTLVSSVSGAISPTMGNILVIGSIQEKNDAFDKYVFVQNNITTFCFACGITLITPFVMIYTKGIDDVNYFHPYLGYFLILAEGTYCYQDPFVNTAYNSNKFRETAKFAYIEAGINIVLSIMLVLLFGVEGIAFATLIAMLYRMISHILYLKKDILYRPIKKNIGHLIIAILIFSIEFIIINTYKVEINTYIDWMLFAVITAVITFVFQLILNLVFDCKQFKSFIKYIKKRV